MEKVWLVIAILTLLFTCYIIYDYGIENAKLYLLFPAVAFAMYAFRRSYRKKMERHSKKNNQD